MADNIYNYAEKCIRNILTNINYTLGHLTQHSDSPNQMTLPNSEGKLFDRPDDEWIPGIIIWGCKLLGWSLVPSIFVQEQFSEIGISEELIKLFVDHFEQQYLVIWNDFILLNIQRLERFIYDNNQISPNWLSDNNTISSYREEFKRSRAYITYCNRQLNVEEKVAPPGVRF